MVDEGRTHECSSSSRRIPGILSERSHSQNHCEFQITELERLSQLRFVHANDPLALRLWSAEVSDPIKESNAFQ